VKPFVHSLSCRARVSWLAAILICAFPPPLFAQTPAPGRNLADLSQHRERWPAQVTLKADVTMTITQNGQAAGSFPSPQGSTVNVVDITPTGIVIGVAAARATVQPEQTDLWDRVTAAMAPPTPVATDTMTGLPALPPITTPPPAPHPAQPPEAPAPSILTPPVQISGPPLQFDVDIPPSGNFTKAAFRFWSPNYSQPIRGVIVLSPGFNGDGRGLLNDRNWQALASKYRLALAADFMQGPDYHVAAGGTGDALLNALGQFADKVNRPELKSAPLLLYGESAGGQFDYNFALWKPERVLAFVVNKGGFYSQAEPDPRMYAVPGLFFLGQTDKPERINAITGLWTAGREHGALWALAPQPHSGHEFSKTAAPARVFFESVLKLRLPDDSAATADGDAPALKALDESHGWLGDLTTHEIRDAAGTDPDHKAAWLPDEASAKAWQAFVSQ
jgi:dienelactone hydrolase